MLDTIETTEDGTEEVPASPGSHAEIAADSYADMNEIAYYRANGCVAEPYVYREDLLPEYPNELEGDFVNNDNHVGASTLQPSNTPKGHGGGSNSSKRRHDAKKPLSALERMDRRIWSIAQTAPEAYLPETEEQKAERHLLEARKRIERQERNVGGRPRLGVELRKSYGIRLESQTVETIRQATGLGIREFVEACVEQLSRPEQAVA